MKVETRNMAIHFIGIGGIGVSALAQYYLARGHKVSGSDLVSSEITELLGKKGARIFIGKHRAENLSGDIDLVIYSPAVREDNPELKSAKRRAKSAKQEFKIQSYPEALGELTKEYFTIAISGTHGKSTTTAMIAVILSGAGLDPTVIVGTKLREFGNSNFRMGQSRYLIIEADEHMASFLNYWPKIIVLTNIDRDHLDYYKNLNNILKAFKEYIGHLSGEGYLVINRDDQNSAKLKTSNLKQKLKIKNYSLGQPEARKVKAVLKIPGVHNVYNALAALTLARIVRVPDQVTFRILSEYRGSWRRFEEKTIKGKTKTYKLVHDYAHHPTEIGATLAAARQKWPAKKIWVVFQPHQYQRTYFLFEDFVTVFSRALDHFLINKLIIADIYDVAGRESRAIKKKVNSQKLVRAIRSQVKSPKLSEAVVCLPDLRQIIHYLRGNLHGGEAVIVMGAGDIYNLEKGLGRF